MTVTVIVDDDDSLIEYGVDSEGQHISPDTVVTDRALLQYAIGNTLHNLSQSLVSGFSYNFTGTEIGVYVVLGPGPAITVPYPWRCTLDGTDMTNLPIQERIIPTIIRICMQDGISASSTHQLTFQNNDEGINIDAFFDYLEYLPLPATTSQKYSYIGISADDPSVQYDGSTPGRDNAEDGTPGFSVPDSNSSIVFTFFGSAITTIAVTEVIKSGSTVLGHFSVDSEPSSVFNFTSSLSINSSKTGGSQPGNIFFQVTNLDETKPHTVRIFGPMDDWGLQSFVVENGTFISNPSATLNSSTTSSSPPNTPRSSTKTNHTAVFVATPLVGVAVVAAMILTWRWIRLHTSRSKKTKQPPIHPFNSKPVRLTRVAAAEIKARRQVIDEENGIPRIPPVKLNNSPDDATAESLNTQQVSHSVEDSKTLQEGEDANGSDISSAVVHVEAEDSGMRGIEETGNNSKRVIIVPPAYTPV